MAADAEAASFLLSFARGSKTAPGEGEADPGGTKTEQKAEQKAEDNGDGVPSPPANRPPSGKDHIEDRPEPGALAQPKVSSSTFFFCVRRLLCLTLPACKLQSLRFWSAFGMWSWWAVEEYAQG